MGDGKTKQQVSDRRLNDKKAAQLGMPFGTANARLRKLILFKYVRLAGGNVCHQCGFPIEDIESFSIEHKAPWMNTDVTLFWDLDNITFSHLSCNIRAARKSPLVHPESATKAWCAECQEYVDKSLFSRYTGGDRSGRTVQRVCKPCMNGLEKYRRA